MANTYNGERVVFVLTEADVKGCAKQMGLPEECITDDVLEQVKKGVEWGLESWQEVMFEAITLALKS